MRNVYLALVLLLALSQYSQAGVRAPKIILGWLETIELPESGMRVKTKLDVGAKTSSMQATNIEQFERDGKAWVRFDFTDEDVDTDEARTLRLEGPLVREVVIKRHGAENVTRPVVTQEFCLYNQIYRTEFSLTDRSKFNYSILLGRAFLSQVAVIDPAATFTSRPDCEGNTSVHLIVD
jgi:hypothetical protein